MKYDRGTPSEVSVSASTGIAIKKVEKQLIVAIATSEGNIRQAVEDLARLKEALRLLRRQKPVSPYTKQMPQLGEPARTPRPRKSKGRIYEEREGSAASTIRSFVRSELMEVGHPLTRSEILDRMTRAGIEVDAKVPIKRIAKVLWNSAEFINVGDGYWLAGQPIPGARAEIEE